MSYILNKTDGSVLLTVQNGTVDNSYGVNFFGFEFEGWGEPLNENFISLLENFAKATQPTNNVRGQLWYDTANNSLKVYNGTAYTALTTFVQAAQSPSAGFGKFWFNTDSHRLFVNTGSAYVPITPGRVTLQGDVTGYADIDISGNFTINTTVAGEAQGALVWTTNGNYRTLTGYVDDGTTRPVRTAEFFQDRLRLTLATFTPSLSAAPVPGTSLNWDVPATGFSVSVTNPTDFLTNYVSAVTGVSASVGSVASLNLFTAGAQSSVPAGGVSWTQSFTNGHIRPISDTLAGGSAAVAVSFNYFDGTTTGPYTASTATFNVSWGTPSMTIGLGSLTGQTFLGSYPSVPYSVTVSGISNSSNYTNSITSSNGTVSSANGSGTFTFTTPLTKDNGGTVRTVSNSITFTRPSTVTGTQYSVIQTETTPNVSGSFTYPSVWLYTASTSTPPTRTNIIDGSGFRAGVTQLANQTRTLSGFINNPSASPQGFWFAVRTSASQPTTFKTGASSSLLSDVSVVTGNTVGLAPDNPPAGYVAESYTLYGITLQPGSTYVEIG
jgi:hypothetical protein